LIWGFLIADVLKEEEENNLPQMKKLFFSSSLIFFFLVKSLQNSNTDKNICVIL